MKIRRTRETGTFLMAALILSAIMGGALASYMAVVRSQHRAVARSVAWNSAIPVAEAGIEEAMAHLNYNSNRAVSGWVLVGTNFSKGRGITGGRYDVTISTNNLKPVITSKATVSVPLSTNKIIRTIRESSGLVASPARTVIRPSRECWPKEK
jgi:hypothetical protein